ncbi:MAG: hypothetical protein QXO37_06925 [Candidatus Nitrosocaldaceae archaeon]
MKTENILLACGIVGTGALLLYYYFRKLQFKIIVKNTGVTHAVGSNYVKIYNDNQYEYYGFEDWEKGKDPINPDLEPDFDYDEPLIRVKYLPNRKLEITILKYGGVYHSDLYLEDKLLLSNIGGSEQNHVGETIIVDKPPMIPYLPFIPL